MKHFRPTDFMKRKALLILWLMALMLAPWWGFAQTTVTCYPPSQTYATGYTDGSTKTSGEMQTVSNGGVQGWMKFDVSSIPNSAEITAITLHFYCTSTSNCWLN